MCEISFIIPNYTNDLKYVEACYNALVSNNHLNEISEIIVIDNNSSSEIFNKITEIAAKYDNFHIVHLEENKGTGYARNLGIKIAKGNYIYFVDNDDLIVPTTILKMLNHIKKYDLDLIFCNTADIINEKIMFSPFSLINFYNINSYKMNININEYSNLLWGWACWRFLLNKNFLINNNIQFNNNSIAEDVFFTAKLYSKMKNIGVINDIGYLHRVGTGISQNVHTESHFIICVNAFEYVLKKYNLSHIVYYQILYNELINGIFINEITVKEYKNIVCNVLELVPKKVYDTLLPLFRELYSCVLNEDEQSFNNFKNILKKG